MQLSFDAADRLVELVQARQGAVGAEEAARVLFALERAPATLAHSLLADVIEGDARLAWLGGRVGLADGETPETLIEDAELVVFDLETTGLSASRDRMCEIGAVRVRSLEIAETFESLVDPRVSLPPTIARLTGLREVDLRRAPRQDLAVRRFLTFAGDAPLAAHNARFDVGFLDHAVQRLTGRRVAAAVIDTVWLARRLLQRRSERFSLAQLAHFFGTSTVPCHRALPDALATAEILVALLGLAQERGARTLAEVIELAAPRERRLHTRRGLVAGAPTTPGVYLFRDRNDAVLYVGKARELRARLRSYFAGDRQRPAVEAALGALARVEWRELGSEVEAALEELRLIRALRPPANARGGRPQSYLRRRGERWVVGAEPTRFGPIAGKRRAQLAARALDDYAGEDLAAALPPLRAKLRRLARDLRFEDAARMRDRVAALEAVVARVEELDRLRSEELCVLAPAREPGFWRAFVVAGGRVTARTIPRGAAGRLEIQACLASVTVAATSLTPEDAADLLVVSGFVRKPPPELRIVPLRLAEIQAA
ncbi:MAG: polymerase epsilon subunit [Gaiellaceae bacterium]|jgi:DNA polymerase-3 subunit epsilon|nr:polymerase epsilon subunit [Gaiellaceae bacterium]